MICGSGGSKSKLAKAAGAEPSGETRNDKLHAVVARSTFASEKAKSTARSEHFWKLRCRKRARCCCGMKHTSKSKCTKHTPFSALLAVEMFKKSTLFVAQSTFRSQNAQNTSASEHFWKLRCRKSLRRCGVKHNVQNTPGSEHFSKFRCQESESRCGAKHISKSKCAKHTTFSALLAVKTFKKSTSLWREAQCTKHTGYPSTLGSSDVEKVYAVVARRTLRSQK